MPEKTMRDAVNEALHQAMEQDDSVFVIGEDVAGCSGSAGDAGAVGGVFGVTEGIYHRWPDRCIDTPISESAIVGAAWVSIGRGGYETEFERMTLKRNGLVVSWTHKYSWLLVDRDGVLEPTLGARALAVGRGVAARAGFCLLYTSPSPRD